MSNPTRHANPGSSPVGTLFTAQTKRASPDRRSVSITPGSSHPATGGTAAPRAFRRAAAYSVK